MNDTQFTVPGNRWDLLHDIEPAELPAVSVVVPYYADRASLDRVLAGLRQQDYPADRFEVVVADDGSPVPLELDGIRVVRQEDRGFRAAAARNLGAAAAQGDVLCFLDGDTVPEPGYLRAITRLPAIAPDVLTVGRRRHADLTGWSPDGIAAWLAGTGPAPEELPAPRWLDEAYERTGDLLHADDESHRFVISAVMCCSARLFRELGGFDERFTAYGGEDWELAWRAWVAGAVFAHVPDAVAWHDGPDWAGRGDEAEREAEKAQETGTLAQLIPSPERTSAGGPADLVVIGAQQPPETSINLAVYPGSAPAEVLARARHVLHLPPGVELDPAQLAAARAALTTDTGQVVFGDPPLTLTSLRAHNRARRWPSTGSSDLFSTVILQDPR